ncbi:MAG: hypothetical protein ACOY71_14525 [Gemmatimonadota bacterium]
MQIFGVLFASVGASLILGALAFVSTLLGVFIMAMVALTLGNLFLEKPVGPAKDHA